MRHSEKARAAINEIRSEIEDSIRHSEDQRDEQTLGLLKQVAGTLGQESQPIVNFIMPEQDPPVLNITVPPAPAPQIHLDVPGAPEILSLLSKLIEGIEGMQAPRIVVEAVPPDVQVKMPKIPVNMTFEGTLNAPEEIEETESYILRGPDQKMLGIVTRPKNKGSIIHPGG